MKAAVCVQPGSSHLAEHVDFIRSSSGGGWVGGGGLCNKVLRCCVGSGFFFSSSFVSICFETDVYTRS